MPLGIALLASAIEKYCPESTVDVIDTTFEKNPLHFIERIVSSTQYDLVGVSVMTTMLKDSLLIASLVKKYHPDTKVVFGGPHTTVMPEETLHNEQVDCVVIGEGEETIVDIIRYKSDFSKVHGVWFKKEGMVVKNPLRKPIEDLDSLPFPERARFPTEKYIRNNACLDSVNPQLRCIALLASRGCPYGCSYCQPTLNKLFGIKLRKRSPGNIIGELEQLKALYKIDSFMFYDDTFIIDEKWVHAFCDELIKSNLQLVWFCNVRANLVNYDLLKVMKDAGLRKVGIGIESGSQRILDEIYNKKITLEQVKESIKTIKSVGLKIQGYFMLGAPTETKDEILQTIRFAKSLDIDEAAFSITTPLPGTMLYEKSKDLIKDDIGDFDYYKKSVYKSTGGLTAHEIELLKRRAFVEFYTSFRRLPQTIKSFIAVKKTLYRLKRF